MASDWCDGSQLKSFMIGVMLPAIRVERRWFKEEFRVPMFTIELNDCRFDAKLNPKKSNAVKNTTNIACGECEIIKL